MFHHNYVLTVVNNNPYIFLRASLNRCYFKSEQFKKQNMYDTGLLIIYVINLDITNIDFEKSVRQ